jgi:hypothetical protein
MEEVEGHILRISTKKWFDHVFDSAMYYTSFRRKWRRGQTIVFIFKADIGDSIVGYGIIENVFETDELSEEEQLECHRRGWKKAIEFKYVIKFDAPLPIRETFLKGSKLRGRYLHGFSPSKEQLEAIIGQAEGFQH